VYGEKYKIVGIFTKHHGKVSALASTSKKHSFSTFSSVDIDYSSRITNTPGFWRLKKEEQTWVLSMNSENHMLVCQSMCFILEKVLPPEVPHENLFAFTEYIVRNLMKFSKTEILALYAYFEFVLLNSIGFGIDLSHYFENSTIKTSNPLSLLKTEQFFLAKIGKDIKYLLEITGSIIENNLLQINNHFRSCVINLI
jgi:recombinational DNA repair protein (RecF pathway)